MLDVVKLDTRDMERGITAVLASAETRSRAFFEGLQPAAKAELRRYKKERRGPDGKRWAPRSPASIERARQGTSKRKKSRTGGLLGKVATSYSWSADNDGLVGDHKIPWAAVHDQGGTVGRGAEVPARRFAGFAPSFSDQVRAAWLDWTTQDW